MKIHDVYFVQPVRIPTGHQGKGSEKPRLITDAAEQGATHWDIQFVQETAEVVITHIASGATVGVPLSNVRSTRPPVAELLGVIKAPEPKAAKVVEMVHAGVPVASVATESNHDVDGTPHGAVKRVRTQ